MHGRRGRHVLVVAGVVVEVRAVLKR
jgi:hypothetical protein